MARETLRVQIRLTAEDYRRSSFFSVCACTGEIAQVFRKLPDKASLVAHNGIFLFVRSRLTVRVMYWAPAGDYFYPFC